jgi:hypothetical protein
MQEWMAREIKEVAHSFDFVDPLKAKHSKNCPRFILKTCYSKVCTGSLTGQLQLRQ